MEAIILDFDLEKLSEPHINKTFNENIPLDQVKNMLILFGRTLGLHDLEHCKLHYNQFKNL